MIRVPAGIPGFSEPVLSAEATRWAEAETFAAGLPARALMESAGREAARILGEAFGPVSGRDVLVLAGRGNNGGDGLVVARELRAAGARVWVVTLASENEATPDTAANLALAHQLAEGDDGLRVDAFSSVRQLGGAAPALVVDALLGIGQTGALRAPVAALAGWLGRQDAPVIALDVPTGLDADTGRAAEGAVRAALTVTFGAMKPGLLLNDGPAHAGRVVVAKIGIPAATLDTAADRPGSARRMTDAGIAALLPRRAPDAHKHAAGRVLAVAGSRDYTGAAVLACGAAMRAGAGSVVCATVAGARATLDAHLAEVLVAALPETDRGTLAITAYDALLEHAAPADALLVGCGLGRDAETARLVRAFARRVDKPLVLDADGLNAFAGHADKLAEASAGRFVLTPHLGELRRLAEDDALDATDRLGTARTWAARLNATLVLKGMPSVVATPDGRAFIGPPPSTALATAGTGDVLAGMIAGLLAQGLEPADAALAALHLGTAAAARFTATRGPSSLIASDLLTELPFVLAERFKD